MSTYLKPIYMDVILYTVWRIGRWQGRLKMAESGVVQDSHGIPGGWGLSRHSYLLDPKLFFSKTKP